MLSSVRNHQIRVRGNSIRGSLHGTYWTQSGVFVWSQLGSCLWYAWESTANFKRTRNATSTTFNQSTIASWSICFNLSNIFEWERKKMHTIIPWMPSQQWIFQGKLYRTQLETQGAFLFAGINSVCTSRRNKFTINFEIEFRTKVP